jgi:hypothetical protein
VNYLHQSNFENSDAFDVTQMFAKSSNFKNSNRLSLTNEVDGPSKFCESGGLRASNAFAALKIYKERRLC